MMSPPIGLGTATVESGARGRTGTTGRTWPLAIRASMDNRPAAMIAEIKAKLAKGCLRNQENVSTATIEIPPYLSRCRPFTATRAWKVKSRLHKPWATRVSRQLRDTRAAHALDDVYVAKLTFRSPH